MSKVLQKNHSKVTAVSDQAIHQILAEEDKAQKALSNLEGELKTFRLGLKVTTDQVAEIMSRNPRIMENITTSLLNSFSFRKKISEEILAHLLEKEEEGRT